MLLAKSADTNGNQESLLEHSRKVAIMAELLYKRLPPCVRSSDGLDKDLQAAALLHDIGKAASGFQEVLLGKRKDWNGWRHEVLSAAFASKLGLAEEVVFAVLTHHRQIPGQAIDEFGGRLRWHDGLPEDWSRLLDDWSRNEANVLEFWRQLCEFAGRRDLLADANARVNSIKLDPAWLDYKLFRRQRKYITSERRLRASLLRGLLISADHLSSGGIETLPPIVNFKGFSPKFDLRDFQRNCARPGNLILRAPTGSGKTEAALVWAGVNQPENGRFFYTLPYTAALN
ncbi:MAG: CRISPR-associated endonuclease Cas3'', partial [Ktedonobacteraceae bacterium]